MLQRPRLKTFLTVFPLSETTWGVRGGSDELWRIKFRDEQTFNALTSILPYLNGKHEAEEIVKTVAAKGVDEAEVLSLLERMEEESLIEEAHSFGLTEQEEQALRSQLIFFSRYTAEGGAKYQSRLRASRVVIIGDGYLARSLKRQLAESGVGELVLMSSEPASALAGHNGHNAADAHHASDGDGRASHRVLKLDRDAVWPEDEAVPDLFIVAQEAEDPQLLDAMDRLSKGRKAPWLLVRAMEANVAWVGPLFIPDETACYQSLEARIRSNIEYFPEYEAFSRHLRQTRSTGESCGGLHAYFELLSAVAVIETVKFLSKLGIPHLAGRFLTINLTTWNVEVHEVLRVPRLGLEVTEPKLFAWKEMPHDEIASQKEGSIYSRRS